MTDKKRDETVTRGVGKEKKKKARRPSARAAEPQERSSSKSRSRDEQQQQQQPSSSTSTKSETEQRSTEMRTAADATSDDPKMANLGEFVLKEIRSLEGVSYYHGMMSRDAVERALTRVGDFLVRATDNRIMEFEFIMSIYNPKRLFSHLIICRDEKRKEWWLNVLEERFSSVLALCQHYMIHPMGHEFRLGRAVSKGKHLLANDRVHYDPEKDLLGEGNFGKVYRGKLDMDKGQVGVALKNNKLMDDALSTTTNTDANKMKKELMNEAMVMSQLRHANVVAFFGMAADVMPALMAIEFCHGGNLLEHLEHANTRIGHAERVLYMLDASAGLKYLHSLSITHRDIAARNCLICVNGFVKLSDFGMGAKCKKVDDLHVTRAGAACPARWMAPEQMCAKPAYAPATDMWSLAILGYEVFANGAVPLFEFENRDVMSKIKSGKHPQIPTIAGDFMTKLLMQVLVVDPSVRLSAQVFYSQLREHCELSRLLTLTDLTLNEKKGVKRQRVYHWDGYLPQVIRYDENGKDLGYQDAPPELIANVAWRGKESNN